MRYMNSYLSIILYHCNIILYLFMAFISVTKLINTLKGFIKSIESEKKEKKTRKTTLNYQLNAIES